MTLQTKPFDIAAHLTDDETMLAYLRDALENDDARGIAQALGDVARAKGGLTQLASGTGLSSQELRRALEETSDPDFATILKIIHALGFKLSASPSCEPVAA